MVQHILPLIPTHELYCEPFCGGAAVFWAKQPSNIETLNDLNYFVSNFWYVLQKYPDRLLAKIELYMHSRSALHFANFIYKHAGLFNRVEKAWSAYAMSQIGYLSKWDSTFAYSRATYNKRDRVYDEDRCVQSNFNARAYLSANLDVMRSRLRNVSLENMDAVKCILSRDNEVAFHYCDPPYINTNCGHYEGYNEQDYERLLNTLVGVKGKFLLSSFPNEYLTRYSKEHGWKVIEIDKNSSATKIDTHNGIERKKKTEVLVMNYEIQDLFTTQKTGLF